MLMPKRVKHRKQMKGRMSGTPRRGVDSRFGEFGLQATECGWLDSRQIEAARIAMTRYIKRGGKIWIRIFPDKPLTSKPAETRMGKGKGSPDSWVCVIKPGTEFCMKWKGLPRRVAREALRLAAHKLPLSTKFIIKEGKP